MTIKTLWTLTLLFLNPLVRHRTERPGGGRRAGAGPKGWASRFWQHALGFWQLARHGVTAVSALAQAQRNVAREEVTGTQLALWSVEELGGVQEGPGRAATTRRMTFDERDIIRTILRFHGADDPALVERLGTFVEWVHDTERAKFDPTVHPAFPLVLLSLIGIHGNDALAAPHRRPEGELP
jgi:hypothetical protein